MSGLKHTRILGDKASWTVHAAYSNTFTGNGSIEYLNDGGKVLEGNENRLTLTSSINFAINHKHHIKGGITDHIISHKIGKAIQKHPDSLPYTLNIHKNYHLTQAFVDWKWRIAPNLSMNLGVHSLALTLNKTYSLDPRFHLKWQVNESHHLALGVGIHSQVQPTALYLTGGRNKNNEIILPNINLSPSKSSHYILSYHTIFLRNFQLTTELYYLYHSRVPIPLEDFQPKYFSGLNFGYDYGDDYAWVTAQMQSAGTGRSYGVEFTIEKPLGNRYYLLFTGSLYDAKYKAIDQISRSTAFNGNYIYNLMLEKEFLTNKEKDNYISINLATTGAGGRRYIPNNDLGFPNQENPFGAKFKDYFRTDVKIRLHQNFKAFSHDISLDVRNIFNTQNVYERYYEPSSDTYQYVYQIGFLPLLAYEIGF